MDLKSAARLAESAFGFVGHVTEAIGIVQKIVDLLPGARGSAFQDVSISNHLKVGLITAIGSVLIASGLRTA